VTPVPPEEIVEALGRLDAITRRLRRECPWDREQDERTIVPHTLEEAYELADAANRRDDAKLLDELGDVLFQVHFLSLLLEERGAGDLAQVADHCREKLIRRHPHVFGEAEAASAGEVLANWDKIKQQEPGREQGLFGEVPENLPSPLYARKVQRRAASSGFDFPGVEGPLQALRDELEELAAAIGEFRRRLPAERQSDWAAAPLPGPDGPGASTAGGSSLVIFKGSRRKEAAWKLISFLSEPETMQRFHALTGDLPPRRSAWRAPALANDPPSQAFAQQLERVRAAPKIPEWERIFQEMQLTAERVVQGRQDAQAACRELDGWVDALLEKRRWLLSRQA